MYTGLVQVPFNILKWIKRGVKLKDSAIGIFFNMLFALKSYEKKSFTVYENNFI